MATPFESVPVPSGVEPLMKLTVPVGVPAPGLTGLTVAVNVTSCPEIGATGKPVSAVVVDAVATVKSAGDDVLPA